MTRSEVDRTELPIPDKPFEGELPLDAKDPAAKFPPIDALRPPDGAPNVVVILLDDTGFGAASAFGGPCDTPTFEKLAEGGLRYNRFHNTALCAPTRAALLTGRNHHSVGMGTITEIATSSPGYTSLRPNTKAPLAETLRLNGYATAQFGKCHEVPVFQNSAMGPFEMWPTGSGFEHFYGFIGGESNQYYPSLYDGTAPVEPAKTPAEGYHLTEDLADHAIDWLRAQQSLTPDKPFFLYFAPGATHAPHHVPKEWIERYKGKFAHGWDRQRELTFARQKELGVIPQDAELTKRHEEIPSWDEMPEELKPVLERQMETYAGFMSHTDHHVGRLIDTLEELEILEDTLIFCIVGDNGASAEGTLRGTFNETIVLNGMGDVIETPEFLAARIDDWGGTDAYNHYAVGWAHAMDTPFQWTKQVASHWGGTRTGTIVHWPKRLTEKGGLRSQFCHVIDIAPTVLEIAGLPEPKIVNGVEQSPYEGTSMAYTFESADAPERHETQYFEMIGNRGIYHQGWSAVTKHRTPWKLELGTKTIPFDEDLWELYDGSSDYSQARDVADENPEKLRELQDLFLKEARKYNVLPLDDRGVERFNAELVGRPTLVKGTRQIFYPGMTRVTESSIINIKNRSFQLTAQLVVPADGARGTIVAQGGSTGGWALVLHEGAARFVYNLLGVNLFVTDAERPVPAGEHQVRVEFAYDGGGLAKGGEVTLYYDGEQVGEGRVLVTQPMIFALAGEGLEVGRELGTTVVPHSTSEQSVFTGEVKWVELSVGEDDHSHLISPADHLQLLITRD